MGIDVPPWRSDQIRSDKTTRVSDKKSMPGLAEELDALAPVTVEVLVVRPQKSVPQSIALDRQISGDRCQLPTTDRRAAAERPSYSEPSEVAQSDFAKPWRAAIA